MKLRDLGFDDWFEALSAEFGEEGCCFSPFSAVNRGSYLVMNESVEVPAELTGRLSYYYTHRQKSK